MISKKVTNWEFPLCVLASIQVYSYDKKISSLMVSLHLGLDYFHKQQHQHFFPFFNERRMIKIVHDRNKLFNKKVIYFLYFILIVVLFVNKMHIFWICNLLMVFSTSGIALFFYKKYVSIRSIIFIINFIPFGIKLNCFKSLSIMYNPFAK